MRINWWENFFHGVALDFWRAVISDQQTAAEASFINRHLQLPMGARILDVPCGNGRLSFALADLGFRLTAIDFAEEFINEIKTKSAAGKVAVESQLRDMRDLPWRSEFDGAFCFGNSFGYLDDHGNQEFLASVARALKPGARFILDAPAIAECLLPSLQPHRSVEVNGIQVEMNTTYDQEQRRMFNEFLFTRNSETEKRLASQRIYSYDELVRLLRDAGFEHVADYSSLTDDAFSAGSQRLLSVNSKT